MHDFERQIPVSYRHALVIPCPWAEMGRVMRELGSQQGEELRSLPEGVRLTLEGGWVFVLPSSDAPQLEITLEADNAASLAQLEQDAVHRVRRLVP